MAGAAFQPGNTLMTDSVVGDKWIRDACLANPTVMLPGEARLISTGPVRLAFCDTLWEPKAPSNNPNGTPKFGTTALYTPFVDMNVFYAEYWRLCAEKFASYWNPHLNGGQGGYAGLESPFHDGANKAHKFQGFTPGLHYMAHTSKFKPRIVDSTPAKNDILDRSKVYAGAWALLVVNAYSYGISPPQPKKGISFGLQGVMLIGDDTNLATGGGIDPREAFANAKVQPPMVNPATLAGIATPPPPGAPPRAPTGGVPGGSFQPPPPPNPLYSGMAHMPQAQDDMDVSSLA